ncbi:MAG TPA: LysR family transcriptional regulator [Burkholderiaceae bacterium]|nr:LysR family transcriptional regulator [Burkholderiaceae bacterium]
MAVGGKTDLNGLLVFAAVAETGGFTAAADQLGVAKAKVSLDVSRLEAQLGVSLFSRTTRRVALTDAGQALYAECVPLLRGVQDALTQMGGSAELTGTLRISAAVDHAVQSLARAVAQFALLHPRLQIDLRTSDRVADVVKEGIDLAIRIGWLRDSTLRATQLGEFEQYVVASPAYLERAGRPTLPEDLAQHEWLALTLLPAPLTWKFTSARGRSRSVRMNGRLRTDSSATLRALLQSGAGVSAMDQFSVAEAVRTGQLVRLLPGWSLPKGGVYAVYPPGRHVPAKVRAFIDFYRTFLGP